MFLEAEANETNAKQWPSGEIERTLDSGADVVQRGAVQDSLGRTHFRDVNLGVRRLGDVPTGRRGKPGQKRSGPPPRRRPGRRPEPLAE